MHTLTRGLVILGFLGTLSCKPKVIVYPDASKVADAQKAWCKVLAKQEAPQDQTWRHTGACKAAVPAGSAPFVAQVTECYVKHHAEQGDNALDLGGLVTRCADEALAGASVLDISNTEPARAYCARMTRCSQVPLEGCMAALGDLDGMRKAAFSSAYSLAAQHAVAECLQTSDCSKDEDAASVACFDAVKATRIWMPPL
ncbi:MAG: hypothetical protein FJ096_09085 [Deltaproteobacteria bacterium]|nr:hypothetical protein [Deltaproteobacteria bacterium]